jgi:hypothetical protein
MRKRKERAGRVLVLFAVLAAGGGCGLKEYEQRIDTQAKYLKDFDEQIKALGPPLDIPRSGSAANPATQLALMQVFFRPPKFIQSQFMGEKSGPFGKWETLYRYLGGEGHEGFSVFIGGVSSKKPLPPGPDEMPQPVMEPRPADFLAEVKEALVAFHEKQYQETLDFPEQKPQGLEPLPPLQAGQSKRPALDYQVYSVDGGKQDNPFRYFLYFIARKGNESEPAAHKIVVIFQLPVKEVDNPEVQRVIESSLRTLEVGNAGEKLRIAYAKANVK